MTAVTWGKFTYKELIDKVPHSVMCSVPDPHGSTLKLKLWIQIQICITDLDLDPEPCSQIISDPSGSGTLINSQNNV